MATSKSSFLTDPDQRQLRLWTEQLYREYEYVLFSHRVKLRPAVLRIAEMGGKWGVWDPRIRTILIHPRLIQEYPWDIVVEVLKHEMAHQSVSESHEGTRPHGPEFIEACGRLGVAEWAVHASGELPRELGEARDRAMSAEEERLLKRVEKLLALANSSNEHEALLAMERVQQMYAKYNLDQARGALQSDMVYLLIHGKRKRIDTIQSMIGSILGEHFFVKVIYGKIYDAADLCHYSVMELLGTKENVLMAEYVHGFLAQQTQSLWDEYRCRTASPGKHRRSYSMGVLSGFSQKLQQMKEERERGVVEASDKALMVLVDKKLEHFVGYRHPRLTTRQWGAGGRDGDSFEQGKRRGRELNLHRPVSGSEGNKGRLLGR